MLHQMTHGKGIAAGYLSRTYRQHPLFSCLFTLNGPIGDLTVNGRSCADDAQAILAANNYRYVVRHKPQDADPTYTPGSWGDQSARAFVAAAFPGRAPIASDALADVYAVDPPRDASPAPATIEVGRGWREAEAEWRWATSPATLVVTSSRPGYAELDITPALIHDPTSPNGLGDRGLVTVQSGDYTNTVEITRDQTTTVPLVLEEGSQNITLALRAGNFRPSEYSGSTDPSLLSFATRSVNLRM
jgi:hypothetical protein